MGRGVVPHKIPQTALPGQSSEYQIHSSVCHNISKLNNELMPNIGTNTRRNCAGSRQRGKCGLNPT